MSKSNSSKRYLVKHYLSLGYRIVGLEVQKDGEPVMDITAVMKRCLIRKGLIPPCQHLSSHDEQPRTAETKKCYHCDEVKSIDQFGIQRNKVFLKTEQREVIREFRRTVCNACRTKERKAYLLKSVLNDRTPNYLLF